MIVKFALHPRSTLLNKDVLDAVAAAFSKFPCRAAAHIRTHFCARSKRGSQVRSGNSQSRGAPRAGSWTTMGKECDSRGPAVCSVCHVRRRSDWDGLDDAAHDLLARGLSRREYGSGEVIFAQGDANTGVYCVSSG